METITELWINEVNVTSQLTGSRTQPQATRTITFTETIGIKPAFSFRGEEQQVGKRGSAMVKCSCTRPGSMWQLDMTSSIAGWNSFYVRADNTFAVGWNLNVFPGVTPNPVTVSTDTSYTLQTTACGTVGALGKIAPVQTIPSPMWAVRYVVDPTNDPCAPLQGPGRRRRQRRLAMKDSLASLKEEFYALEAEASKLEL